MNKKFKILSCILSAAMASWLMINSLSVFAANVDVDKLYIDAYTATVNALNTKTQKSINNARAAIDALNGTDASWAIGEFSKQVDSVQQPILVKIVDAIKKAQLSGKQADINAAKAAIDKELPIEWRGAYSSAVDVVEQELMKNALAALDKATKDKVQADIDAAKAILNEIKTSADTSIVSWVDKIGEQLPTTNSTGGNTGSTTGNNSGSTDDTPPTDDDPPVVTTSISNVSIDVNSTSGKVTIQGAISSGSGKNVTIKILNSSGNLDYINQVASEDKGVFTFVYIPNGIASGNYVVNLCGEGITTQYQKSFAIK